MRPESRSSRSTRSTNSTSHHSLCDVCRPCFESICQCQQDQADDEETGLLIPHQHEDVSQIPQFISKFYTPLKTGTVIEVRGLLPEDSERFAINLCSGEAGEDIAFHFNPRLSQNYIARNSRQAGEWGREESASALPYEIKRGREFIINVFVAKDDFLVSVNGKHFCGFAFRAALKSVRIIRVTGDARNVRVQQRTSDYYPEVKPEIHNINLTCTERTDNETKVTDILPVPYLAGIPEVFRTGKQLQIRGRVKILPHSFFVNLQNSPYIYPHPDIILHVNPRFGEVGGVHVVVRNSWLGGSWGPEQKTVVKGFCPGKEFRLSIRTEQGSFTIWLNDYIIAEYKARSSVQLAKFLYIQGDVELHEVCLMESDANDAFTTSFDEE